MKSYIRTQSSSMPVLFVSLVDLCHTSHVNMGKASVGEDGMHSVGALRILSFTGGNVLLKDS